MRMSPKISELKDDGNSDEMKEDEMTQQTNRLEIRLTENDIVIGGGPRSGDYLSVNIYSAEIERLAGGGSITDSFSSPDDAQINLLDSGKEVAVYPPQGWKFGGGELDDDNCDTVELEHLCGAPALIQPAVPPNWR